MIEPLFAEFVQWRKLIGTVEWQNYIRLLEDYEEFLQKEVNRCIRDGDKEGAIRFLAQKDVIPKILGKVTNRINACKEGEK